MDSATEWTLDGFVEHFDFVHHKMPDYKFVWMLGAGASYASGIPLGSELVDEWLGQLHLREDGKKTPIAEWATAQNLRIEKFTYEDRASFYPKVYERRFRNHPDEGYAYLESVMSGKDPSPGYSILAAALAADPARHNAVITTNFDNLVADALSIYTDTFPFVCGHESLAGFVRVAMRRPFICKLHRDLLLAPQSKPHNLSRLHDDWGRALRDLFQHYTPIFIGYGGNDDTLMHLLGSMEPEDIKGRMIWCYYEGGNPSQRIIDLVTYHRGILVPVPDFDLLMVMLGEKMDIALLDEEIGRRAAARTERYRERVQALDTVDHPSAARALAATLDRSGGWWAWNQKAEREKDPERSEVVYRQGILHCPQSAELHNNFAIFLSQVRGNRDEAEQLYRTALELNPKNDSIAKNFAIFMSQVLGKHDEAERLYKRAIKLAPKDARHIGDYATFMTDVRRNLETAERLYREALELDPNDALNTGNYAEFLLERGRLAEAVEKIEKATLLNDGNKNHLAAAFALCRGILAKLMQQDDTQAIDEMLKLLSAGFSRLPWNFDGVLEVAREKLSPEDYALYEVLAAAILDAEKVPIAEALLQERAATEAAAKDQVKPATDSAAALPSADVVAPSSDPTTVT